MRIAVVDPDKKALHNEIKSVRKVFDGCEAVMFIDPQVAERYLEENAVDALACGKLYFLRLCGT